MIVEEFEKLPFRAKEIILENINFIDKEKLNEIILDIKKCKSPIEIILIIALDIINSDYYFSPQEKIICGDKNYIADFCLYNDGYVNTFLKSEFKLVIECDGYEFHQKTKEQVQKDNERELALKMAGYDVLRFSGTQIFNNPLKCAEDTYNYIIKKIQEE
jgi:very-short-patch-repair endonuclease